LRFPSAAEALNAAFEDAHKSRFGFVSPDRDLVFDMLEVEAIGATDAGAPPAPAMGERRRPWHHVDMHGSGRCAANAPIYAREDLPQSNGNRRPRHRQ
jgi:5-oxoprolinase (ATP-hydrolysing)